MKNLKFLTAIGFLVLLISCKKESDNSNYFNSEENGIKIGGVKMVTIETPKGKFNVWTKRIRKQSKNQVIVVKWWSKFKQR
jgi:proline iminopeptidase